MSALASRTAPATIPSVGHQQPLVQRLQPSGVHATVNYTQPHPGGEQLFTSVAVRPDGTTASNLQQDAREVLIRDIHTSQRQFSLHQNGFQLEPIRVADGIDWTDDSEVQSRYYPAVQELIKQVSGASKVHIFDHTVRLGHISGDPNGVGAKGKRAPVGRVHVDYNVTSGPQRMHAVMPEEEAETLSRTPFAVIQVWRPLRPVESSPLAMVDAATVAKTDLMDLRIEFENRTGYNYAVQYNPDHHWFYAKGMTPSEAYVFKCYDSRSDRARFTPHTGFEDPTASAAAPPRESIEIRAYVFWENEEPQPIAQTL